MARYKKVTITLRDDVYDLLTHLMAATGLSRAGAVSLIISHADPRTYFPELYLKAHPEVLERVYQYREDDEEPPSNVS